MYLVVRIHPVPFLESPFEHLLRRCFDDMRKNKLLNFDSAGVAERFIKKQQILAQQHFMLLEMTSMQQKSLLSKHLKAFFEPLRSLYYYSPLAQSGHTIEYMPNFAKIADKNHDHIYKQNLALHEHQRKPITHGPLQVKTVNEIKSMHTLPDDFKLPSNTKESIQSDTYIDPISLDSFNTIPHFACVKLANGYYNVYDLATLFKHYSTNSEDYASFKDPLSGLRVNIKDVFTVSPEVLKAYANAPVIDTATHTNAAPQNLEPRRINRSSR